MCNERQQTIISHCLEIPGSALTICVTVVSMCVRFTHTKGTLSATAVEEFGVKTFNLEWFEVFLLPGVLGGDFSH